MFLQINPRTSTGRKSIHQFQLTKYADGRNYFDLKDNYKEAHPRKFRSSKLTVDYQASPVHSIRSDEDETEDEVVKGKVKFSNSFCKDLSVRTTIRRFSVSTEELFQNDNDDSSQGGNETNETKFEDAL